VGGSANGLSSTFYPLSNGSRDGSVGKSTGYRVGGRNSIAARLNILYSAPSRPALKPTQPPIQWVPGEIYPGDKAAGAWSWHLPPSSVEAKNGGAILALSHMSSWRGAELTKHREKLSFFLTLQEIQSLYFCIQHRNLGTNSINPTSTLSSVSKAIKIDGHYNARLVSIEFYRIHFPDYHLYEIKMQVSVWVCLVYCFCCVAKTPTCFGLTRTSSRGYTLIENISGYLPLALTNMYGSKSCSYDVQIFHWSVYMRFEPSFIISSSISSWVYFITLFFNVLPAVCCDNR
jgi:hypothetical protein